MAPPAFRTTKVRLPSTCIAKKGKAVSHRNGGVDDETVRATMS